MSPDLNKKAGIMKKDGVMRRSSPRKVSIVEEPSMTNSISNLVGDNQEESAGGTGSSTSDH